MGLLNTASAIFTFAALRIEKRTVQGQEIVFREMTVAEKSEYQQLAKDKNPHLAAWLVHRCTVFETGEALFMPDDFERVKGLKQSFLGDAAMQVLLVCGYHFADEGEETPKG